MVMSLIGVISDQDMEQIFRIHTVKYLRMEKRINEW